jgi:hypothetical protein
MEVIELDNIVLDMFYCIYLNLGCINVFKIKALWYLLVWRNRQMFDGHAFESRVLNTMWKTMRSFRMKENLESHLL